ncbi:MAG: TRIC cation channel family protein, partial [Desulfovibrionales bacterium]|nr:TRIC cation channel family protein [Desulfovibrionales bacterium]
MLSPVLSACSHAQTPSPVRELSSGWYNRPPYQMLEPSKGGNVVTGLEIKAAQELFDNAGYQVSFESMSWSDMLASLKTGSIDFVMGAYYEKSRAEYCYYSIPYRYEKNAIYIHKGYNESMNLVLQGHADFFVANPVIADRILAKTSHASQIKKIDGLFPEIPVHVMFSKETITPEQVAGFNEIIESMINDNRFRSLHIEFLLPVYLSITTEQFWFDLLTLLGIVAFCFSGVLIARKERYNLVGALVLSILPAIGGGVLRDIFLGADKVFVLKTPAFMLVAVGVVILSFLGFKSYDYFTFRYRKKVSRLKIFAPKHLEGMFNRLFKFFDAWAVATFTIVGVNAAVESQVTPLWLWGPAMGALTASGGVVLRDIVRAEFNIEMLKQDSYAEISIFGGIIYTGALLVLRYDITQNLIFYLTMFMIVFLFAIRFFILWKGWVNPLQFGADRTHPDARMKEFERLEPELW